MIITINNKKYDLTEFINEHPGGREVFKNGEDMTQQFNAVGHSPQAIKMMEKYLMKEEHNDEPKQSDEIQTKSINYDDVSISDLLQHKWNNSRISKLFTHEDYLNVHKILGLITLINILYFLFDLAYSGCKGVCTIRKFDSTFFILLFIQVLLSLSALQFSLPKNFNNVTISMGEEYRLHSILFTLRSVFVILTLRFCQNTLISRLLIILIVFLSMYMADFFSYYYKAYNKEKGVINTIPFWSSCPSIIQNILTRIYTITQISATFLLISGQSTIELNFAVIFVIQLTAFMKTLSRKGIINNFQWHLCYLLEFAVVGILFLFTNIFTSKNVLIIIFLYLCRTEMNVNKFFLWTCVSLICLIENTALLTGSLILSFFIFRHYNLCFDPIRKKSHNVILSNKPLTNTKLHLIEIKLIDPIQNYYPGQYVNLFVNKEKRPYTPISTNSEKNVLQFFIKNYENKKISDQICNFAEEMCIHVDGPFGKNYYDTDKDELVCNSAIIKQKHILMFYCGTGITPFYSILTSLTPDTRYKFKVFGSLNNEDENYFTNIKQKIFYSNNKITTKKLQKILKKYDPKSTIILTCGNERYNQLFKDIENFVVYKW